MNALLVQHEKKSVSSRSVVNDKGGNVKGLRRSNYPMEINRILERVWAIGPHPPTDIVDKLSVKTGLMPKKVRQWFRNKRKRTKRNGFTDPKSWDSTVTPEQLRAFRDALSDVSPPKSSSNNARVKKLLPQKVNDKDDPLEKLLMVATVVYHRDNSIYWNKKHAITPACC